MALADEQKQFYVDAITTIWKGTMQDNEIENITNSVADKIEKVLYEIRNCSDAVKSLFLVYAPIYDNMVPPNKWVLIIPSLSPPIGIHAWISFLLSKQQFKMCVNSAALNWGTVVQEDLSGWY